MTTIYLGQPSEVFAAKSYVRTCRELAKWWRNMARKWPAEADRYMRECETLRNTAKAYMQGIKEYEERHNG